MWASMRRRSPHTPTLPFLPRLDPYLPVGGRGVPPPSGKTGLASRFWTAGPILGTMASWPTSRGVPSGRQSAGPPVADGGRLHTEDISWVTGTRRRDVQRRRSVRRTGVRRAHGRGCDTEDIFLDDCHEATGLSGLHIFVLSVWSGSVRGGLPSAGRVWGVKSDWGAGSVGPLGPPREGW